MKTFRNPIAKNMFSTDVKRVCFRCQTLKFSRPNSSLLDLKRLYFRCQTWIAQAWEAVEPSIIVKCFTNAGVLDKERNVVKALAPPSDEDPFSDLEDDVLQVNALLEESCGDTATSADESIADENLLPVCQEVDEHWEQKFLSSLSQNSDSEDGASEDEEIVEMDDVLPEPLKIKSYKEALSELNHVTNFFTAQGTSQLADELSKVVSKAQSLYLKQRLENAVQKKITDFFDS